MDHYLCVRGITYRQAAAAKVTVGDSVAFRPEPHNEHDPHAIAILTFSQGQWQQIGYVPKELTSYLRPLLPEQPRAYAYPGAHVCEVKSGEGPITVWVRFSAERDIPRQSTLPRPEMGSLEVAPFLAPVTA